MAYTNPPPPFEPPPAGSGNDGYGWQGQSQGQAAPPPQQPYQAYQQPYQQPYQQYAQPGAYYPGPMAPANSGFAIASLICSILGFIGFAGIGSILGVVFGHMAIREIDRSNGRTQGRGMAQAGLILGYIGVGIIVLVVLFFVIVTIIGIGAATISPNG